MTSTLVLGPTGLVGSHILSTLRSSPSQVSSINVIARRPPPSHTKAVPTTEFINKDLTTWAPHIESISPSPSILFSALATNRAAAGGLAKQYQFDHDNNLELAKAAHKAGTKTYVLISSGGADPKSWMPYMRMKGDLDEHVQEIGFEHTIILRPGLLFGDREEGRWVESAFRLIANSLGKISSHLKDSWSVDADVVAKAAVAAGLKASKGEVNQNVWILDHQEIVNLGKTEWEDV